jgi:hypothetical protein
MIDELAASKGRHAYNSLEYLKSVEAIGEGSQVRKVGLPPLLLVDGFIKEGGGKPPFLTCDPSQRSVPIRFTHHVLADTPCNDTRFVRRTFHSGPKDDATGSCFEAFPLPLR